MLYNDFDKYESNSQERITIINSIITNNQLMISGFLLKNFDIMSIKEKDIFFSCAYNNVQMSIDILRDLIDKLNSQQKYNLCEVVIKSPLYSLNLYENLTFKNRLNYLSKNQRRMLLNSIYNSNSTIGVFLSRGLGVYEKNKIIEDSYKHPNLASYILKQKQRFKLTQEQKEKVEASALLKKLE